ncbi:MULTISPECIES: MBL fold metallo-hydrolase [unclassified Plantactinospora]|uniref:MBL fold metallo-hydrolase n=1 Tax=unclassified Plantactinospora TaxID=2631981 RepID=UPI000D15FD33|nr:MULTISPECIES: MBL fold metallo-hydrolase [unclassified Plantactinospora]AVT31936.1 MBL fold metallo-hydrolase [Plantactinospora sp. BC1]AVT40367.1 MBL fold metallo-hydrolase [Plantactinospora sp. BB1]
MLVAGFPADAFGTNCYVVATAPGEQCVVVDPGIGVLDRLDDLLAEHRLRPAAVLLTHGHLDHTFSVAPVCGARGIPAYVHPGDRELLADPAKGLSADLTRLFGGRLPYTEPEDVAELTDGATLALAGLEITVDHAPGHTGGSVLFRLPGTGSAVRSDLPLPPGVDWAAEQICLAGDVLFAGSIGRTDLPGGSSSTMVRSLREKILPLADDTVVLPGHGPATSIGRERASNPYLIEVAGPDGPRVASTRGW